MLAQERRDRHHETRGAEPALQPVRVAECLLHCGESAVGVPESLDRGDLAAIGLNREHQARADRGAVDQHRACSAHAVLASQVSTGQVTGLAEEVGQDQTRLDSCVCRCAVDDDLDRDVRHVLPPGSRRSTRV